MFITLPVIIAIIGLIMFLVFADKKSTIGLVLFALGMAVVIWQLATHA